MTTPFEITKEEVLNLAAQKVADEYAADSDLHDTVHKICRDRVKEIVKNGLVKKVDEFLVAEMTKILNQQINPVDIWGDRTGAPTTIREQLSKRAQEFWNVRVDAEGKPSSYGGEERFKHLFKQIVAKEFGEAVKANCDTIVAGFKKALLVDAVKITTANINRLIK